MRIPISHRSAYAPIRYEATRPYARTLGRMCAARRGLAADVRLRFLSNDLMPLLRSELRRLGREQGPGPAQTELVNVQVFGKFDAGGRIVFDVSKPLAASLAVTDANDIPCGELQFPSPSFYLHFGSGTGLRDDGFDIEGAFVAHDGTTLLIDLVRNGFGYPDFLALPMGEPLLGVSIDLSVEAETVTSALDRSIAATLDANRAMLAKMAQTEAELAAKYGQVVHIPHPIERLENKGPLLRAALQLVVNTIFFLAAEPEDVQQDWEAAAPADLVRQAESAPRAGGRTTAANTLRNAGYIKVSYVGRRYGASVEAQNVSAAVGTGRVLATHLRRGHFRLQPHGPERALRKRIFIPPAIINPDRGGTSPGRIYEA